MCELGLILGLASGAASAVETASAANANQQMIAQQAQLEQSANQREFLVDTNAANKDAYKASLERDRGKAFVSAMGAGMRGPTAGLRSAEQSRQGALSIANARDRFDAAQANYAANDRNTVIGASNRMRSKQYSPMTAFTDIATAGISNYGAFK